MQKAVVAQRRAAIVAEIEGGEDNADAQTRGQLAFLDGVGWHDNPHCESGLFLSEQDEATQEWAYGWEAEQRRAELQAKIVADHLAHANAVRAA